MFAHLRTQQKDKVVCGFSSVEGMALVNVEGSGLIGIPGVDKRLFGALEYHGEFFYIMIYTKSIYFFLLTNWFKTHPGVNVSMISQASSEHSCTFATSVDQSKLAKSVSFFVVTCSS